MTAAVPVVMVMVPADVAAAATTAISAPTTSAPVPITAASTTAIPATAVPAVPTSAVAAATVPASRRRPRGSTTPVPTGRFCRAPTALVPAPRRILGQSPDLKGYQEVLPWRHDLSLDRLSPWNGAESSAGRSAARGIGGRRNRVHDRVRERVAELEAHRCACDRQTIGVGQLDHQRGRQRFADGGALVVAAHDAEGGGNALSGARQRQVLAAAGEGNHYA